MLPRSIFVLGGAASGKSVWAEEFLKLYNNSMTYVATGQVFDDEVSARVKIHQSRRDEHWKTIEEPHDLAGVVTKSTPNEVLLIDCATMWLTNHLVAESDLELVQQELIAALDVCPAPWIIVSNEVGQGIVPDNAMARQFREAQGRLNIALAMQAELVVQVAAGLPQVLKGSMP